jgi:glyoxylase-like metal-dependent hydrolase (beta-lactamase superfamily II)
MSRSDLPPSMHFIERDWLSANGVLFDDGRRTTLVDTGYDSHRDTTLAVLRTLLGDRPLDQIVNTHLHSDHCGGNALLQRTWGSRTLIPAASAQAVSAWDENGLTYDETGQRCERFAFDDVIEDGQILELGGLPWQAIAAPGHDPEMMVLYCEPQRLLISADALWQNGFGVIFPELDAASGFTEQRAILDRLATLEVDRVIPGHGPMFTDMPAAIARARQRLDYLAADPARNARHATKVLVKFLLLEHRSIPMDQVPGLIDTIPLIRRTNERYTGLAGDELVRWVTGELVRAGAARIENERLIDA